MNGPISQEELTTAGGFAQRKIIAAARWQLCSTKIFGSAVQNIWFQMVAAPLKMGTPSTYHLFAPSLNSLLPFYSALTRSFVHFREFSN